MSGIGQFENRGIRSVRDQERGAWYFSAVDVAAALTESSSPRDCRHRVKKRRGRSLRK